MTAPVAVRDDDRVFERVQRILHVDDEIVERHQGVFIRLIVLEVLQRIDRGGYGRIATF